MIPAIVLSAHTIALGVIRSLGMMGVPVVVFSYNEHDMGHVSKYVKMRVYSPHPEKDENEFIRLLMELGGEFKGSVILPADDQTLTVTSRYKDLLSKHYRVGCTEWEITEKFIDKKRTYALAETIGIPVPRTIVPMSESDVEKYGSQIDYPCVIKPSIGHRFFEIFGTKMVRVENYDQMLSAYREATEASIEVMIHELIPGDDTHGVNYNSYIIDGVPVAEFTSEKVRLAPPGFGVPRVLISKSIPEVIEPGRKILHALGYYGYSCTEFKKDSRDGVYKLMEVNGRHNLSTLLSVKCGINFPWINYRHLALGEVPSKASFRTGIYWIDLTKDIAHSITHYKRERYSTAQYLRPYLRPHVFAILDMKDLKPFVKRNLDFVKSLYRALISLGKGVSKGMRREAKA